ncbi:MAG: hypothetical protein V2J25_08745 [Desulfatiglans sp.]|jgi:hypothetical protein|nr:hypothetical protein [Desulfatiglans sp.]
MTHEDRGHYAGKHPSDRKADPKLIEALEKRSHEGKLSCAGAFEMAKKIGVSPGEVGFTADFLEMSIVKCQLGLFGYRPHKKIIKPAETVSKDLQRAIQELTSDGRIACKDAWAVAEKLKLKKMDISSACEALKIKITPCQLGAF